MNLENTIKKASQILKDHNIPDTEVDKFIMIGDTPCSDICFGNNAKIGANAVVTKDVPENAVMVGIPAKTVGTASISKKFTPYGIAPDDDTKKDT